MATWHPVNAYQMQISWMSLTGDVARLQRVLETLGDAIKASAKRLDGAQRTGNAEWAEVVLDEECAITEDLIGTAFVVCQTYITGVASRVIGLHRHHDRQNPGNRLQTTSGSKYQSTATSPSIFRFGSRKIGRSGRTAVEVIDAFANYFKHREEWVGSWTKLNGPGAKTAQTIMSVGAKRGSTGNLRTGAERLGNKNYSDFGVFMKCLRRWTNNLLEGYTKELHRRGLITVSGAKSVRRRRV
jgi:hypothetical protein